MKHKNRNHFIGRLHAWSCLWVILAGAAGAHLNAETIDILLQPTGDVFEVGQIVDVGVFASTNDLLVGFGFDLLADGESVIAYEGFDANSGFTGVPTPDGDGLAGLSFSGGVVGSGVLLGTAHYLATAPGEALLELSTTDGDLTEGFAGFGQGFFDVVTEPIGIQVVGDLGSSPSGGPGPGAPVPEPATLVLLVSGLLAIFRTRAYHCSF